MQVPVGKPQHMEACLESSPRTNKGDIDGMSDIE